LRKKKFNTKKIQGLPVEKELKLGIEYVIDHQKYPEGWK
jgi:hypothetical protein